MTAHSFTSVRVRSSLLREEGSSAREQKQGKVDPASAHTSVMLEEVLQYLDVKKGEQVLDATAGQGGHCYAILKNTPGSRVLALDADPVSVDLAGKRLAPFGERAQVVEANFGDIEKVIKKQGIKTIDKALFDLGWNSGQLGLGRGFSFLVDEPLDMSYGTQSASSFTAAEALNEWEEETLANVFYGYGEERYARRIAKAIVERRETKPFATTLELVEVVRDSTPSAYHRGRLHFATRTFQGLRMAVNDELGVINRGVTSTWEHLSPGGRIAVITFHSIEDRAVKRLFADFVKGGGRLVFKKPLVPSRAEVVANPRARSAKLRVIEKSL
ncbi:MAG: 16S rRNA (cytosine(1402)-N(4))-methyltransferase RsmH [Candidatus Adlerbacteria bacterium]|nr:16S rRNA (cytosine(1402)-N(4))-methyltransferase RsmH [Candidatus Adlerbacteria bacterium]